LDIGAEKVTKSPEFGWFHPEKPHY